MTKSTRPIIAAVVLLLALAGLPAYTANAQVLGGTGTATLGQDLRLGRAAPPNFGFAFMQGPGGGAVLEDPTHQQSYSDTCATLDNQGNNTLTATDGVASPEYPEMVYAELNGTNTVTFAGRTCDCYYMVTGAYAAGSGGSGGSGTSTWDSDFDTNNQYPALTTPHFVVYINDRYSSEDDVFNYGSNSTVFIEVANPTSSSTVSFQLSQQSSNNGKVDIMQDDGVTPEPLTDDGKTQRVYTIQPSLTEPNGPFVAVQVTGLDPGDVIIIATEAAGT